MDATAGAGWKSFDFTNPYKAGANQLLIDFKVRGNGTLTWFLDQLCTTFENNPIPNCTNLTGPASLCVNSAGTYSADFSSAAGNLSGEINAGQNGTFLWYPSSQAISGTSGNRSFTWTPNTSGTYDLFCRAWNDSIAECRGKAAYIDGPPRYLCSGPTSSLTVTVNPAVAGEWTGYGACSAVEGPGTKTRTCTNPAPSCGGASCVGSATSNCCVASYPDIPSLSTPINNSTIGSSSVALDWNDVTDWGFGTADNITCTNANQYNVYLDTGLNPTTLKCTTNSTTTNCPVTGLTAGTYYWKVTATNGTLSTTSAVRKLVVQPFSAPTISYLSNTDNSITWQWNNPNSPNADYVWFQLSTSNAVNSGGSYPGSFQTTVSPSGGIYGITNTHIDYPTLTNTNTNLTCDVDYYAHVRAESDNPDFSPSSWSNIATFKIPATEPEKPTINSPGINTAPPPASVPILGNLNVAFDWDEPTDWGLGCPTNNNTYKLYAGTDRVLVTNGDASTLIASNLTSPAYTYSVPGSFDGQQIYWMVEASNGSEKAPSAVWTFWIKQPKICGPSLDSILYEDADRDVCYKSGTEPQINNAAITVLANGQTCSRPTAATFCCTIPGNNNGSSTVVNLTASGYEPYTGTTGCSTGTFPACSDNNCTFTLDPGDNVTANIGFEVKPWFQADSGSVYTAGYIASLIPGTPKHYDSGADIDKYFILNQAGPLMTGNNSAPNFGTGTASSPNWWDRNYSLDMNKFNYNFFQTKLANKITQNITGNAVLNNGILTANSTEYPITNNTLWNITGTLEADNATNLDGINAAFLVSGNITIKGNITPAPNISSLAFISGGNINIDPSVVEIRGLYLATGNFNDGLNNSQGLKIKGNAAALNQIILQRDWGTGYKPAEYFVSDPALYINLAQIFGLPSYTWSEVAP